MERRPAGARGFDDAYWRATYGEPERMDGVVNAEAHARYLRACFDVGLQEVSSIVDLGFGLGHLFEAILAAFEPYRALGIEPSGPAFEATRFRLRPPERTRLKLEQVDLAAWCRRPDHPRLRHDLGVCTSVWQYLSDEELEEVVPVLARRVRWLYLTVPTDEEYALQARDMDFTDPYATARPAAFYRDLLRPSFEPVGARLLESRELVGLDRSPFTDLLWRG